MIRFQIEKMKDFLISFDPQANAAYVKIREGKVHKTKEEAPGILVDLGANGQLLGVELLDPQRIEIKIMLRLAKEFNAPVLSHVNPKAIPRVYATA